MAIRSSIRNVDSIILHSMQHRWEEEVKEIIYIINGHTTYAILVHKANEWLNNNKHIGRTVRFIECDTKKEAAAIDMQRFGYHIQITDLELVR